MIAPDAKSRPAESLSGIYQVDSVCDQFEEEWRRGSEPSIQKFLNAADQSHAGQLFAELVRVDIFYRRKSGEHAGVDDYIERFPQYSWHLATLNETPLSTGLSIEPGRNRRIGDYELRDRIGVGSFGTVWRAWHQHLDRIDAIKLPLSRFDGRDQIDAFHHEARAAARLNHPNIVRVIGFGEWNEAGYIVFEYIQGLTLKEWRQREEKDHEVAARLCLKLADALNHAHELNVVHRDLKPGNILIDGAGEPHVSDFGLAKRLDVESTIASDGAIMGTVPYMSPEQVVADHTAVGPSTDVYSLGVILYELLTGSLPFQGERSVIMDRIQHNDPPSLRGQDKSIPNDLETICLKALQKDLSDRYETAAELRDDLQRYLQGQPVRARRTTLMERTTRWSRQHPVLFAVRVVALAVSLTTLAVLGSDARDDGRWEVGVVTDRPGARLNIQQILPGIDIPIDEDRAGLKPKQLTPLNFRLAQGKYRVIATIEDGDEEQFVEAIRSVPERPRRAEDMSKSPNHPDWQWVGDNKIVWTMIKIPSR